MRVCTLRFRVKLVFAQNGGVRFHKRGALVRVSRRHNSEASAAVLVNPLQRYPKQELAVALRGEQSLYPLIFEELRKIDDQLFLSEGRVYGGGLHKELER